MYCGETPAFRRQLRCVFCVGHRGGPHRPQPGQLRPRHSRVQVLDHGLRGAVREGDGKSRTGSRPMGCVSGRGKSRHDAVPARGADTPRELPAQELSKGVGEWNHYTCGPSTAKSASGERRGSLGRHRLRAAPGFLCLESEGAPIEFKICASASCLDAALHEPAVPRPSSRRRCRWKAAVTGSWTLAMAASQGGSP